MATKGWKLRFRVGGVGGEGESGSGTSMEWGQGNGEVPQKNMKKEVNATEKWPLRILLKEVMQRGGKHFYFFFQGNSWPLLYWKLHPLAVVCVEEAFIGLPRDLSNIFKDIFMGKRILSSQLLIYQRPVA